MRHVSFRAILLPIFASCIFGVLTYASVKASKNRNAFEAAFTDLTHILGSLPGEKRPTINAARRSSKGVNVQKPAINASAGVGMVYAPTSQEKVDAMVLQQPSSLVTTRPADLPVGIYNSERVPVHSSSNELAFAVLRSDRSPLGFDGAAATSLTRPILSSASTPPSSPRASKAPAPITESGRVLVASASPATNSTGVPSAGGLDDAINVNFGQPVFKDGVQVSPASQQVQSTGSLAPAQAAAVVASTESTASNATPVSEPSWFILASTAFAFSVLWGATRTMRTWLSRRRDTHS